MMLQLRSATPVARKAHRCDWCYTTIRPRTRYRRSTNVYDDRLYDWVACLACDAMLPDVWDWSGQPDEGVSEDSYAEWSHENDGRADAGAYLDRRGCTCGRCTDRRAAERLLSAAVEEARRLIAYHVEIEEWPGHVGHIWRTHDFRPDVAAMLAEATRAADLLLKGRPE